MTNTHVFTYEFFLDTVKSYPLTQSRLVDRTSNNRRYAFCVAGAYLHAAGMTIKELSYLQGKKLFDDYSDINREETYKRINAFFNQHELEFKGIHELQMAFDEAINVTEGRKRVIEMLNERIRNRSSELQRVA